MVLIKSSIVNKKNFKFQGFVPSSKLKKISQNFYNLVENRSPSDSKKQAVLIKKGSLYEARLKIISASSCSFEISSKEDNSLRTINALQEKFLNKILNWNKNRNPQNYYFNQ